MIRRRGKGRAGNDAEDGPEVDPSSGGVPVEEAPPTIQQPAIPASDEPSAQVLDELLSFFGVRHGHHGHQAPADPPPPPPAPRPAPEPAPEPEPADVATSAATRMLRPDELAAGAVGPPPPSSAPAGVDDLVPAPTKRSTRRSRREAKREDRLASKRLAELAKQEAKLAKRQAKQARKHPPSSEGPAAAPPVDPLVGAAGTAAGLDAGLDAGESVRILPGPPPGAVAPPAPPPAAPAEPAPVVEPSSVGDPPLPVTGAVAERATISIVGDDDLPDAVYLDGDLSADGADGRAATIFIDDQDPVSTLPAGAATPGRIEPRLRDRRIAVKRAIGRKRLKWIAAGVVAVGAVVGVLAVLGSGLFAIHHIRVEGAVYSQGTALDEILADLEGANVLRVDTAAVERQLERIPWVADARVTTDFPNGAVVEIRERQPVLAYEGSDQHFRVIDADGRVLAVLDGQPVDYLPLVVDTAEAPNAQAGEFTGESYRTAARLALSLGPLRGEVASIAVDVAGSDLRLEFHNGVEVRFGAARDVEDKLVRLQTALQSADPDHPPTELIDVSTDPFVTR